MESHKQVSIKTISKPTIEEKTLQSSQNSGEFLLRRLHSLAGLLPLGLFLAFHLTVNNAAVKGPEAFNFVVAALRSIPYLPFVEMAILGIPFLFHGLYGLIITPNVARTNLTAYSQSRNWAYFMQRITGIIVFVFLAVHICQFRFNEDLDFHSVASSLRQPAWAIAYLIGITATVYHFANGLWNFFISWGITVGKKAQKVSAVACSLIGFVLLGIGLSALWAFYSAPPVPTKAVIQQNISFEDLWAEDSIKSDNQSGEVKVKE